MEGGRAAFLAGVMAMAAAGAQFEFIHSSVVWRTSDDLTRPWLHQRRWLLPSVERSRGAGSPTYLPQRAVIPVTEKKVCVEFATESCVRSAIPSSPHSSPHEFCAMKCCSSKPTSVIA